MQLGVPICAFGGPQRVDHSCTAYPHAGVPYPHLFGALRSPDPDGQSRGAVVQAFDDTRPRPLRPPPPGPSGARVPPHDVEAEESLLGAMLLSNDAASVGIEKCSAGDFYKPAHGHIFGAIQALMERGEAIDAVTVTDELKRSGRAGGGRGPVRSSSRCWPTRRRSPTRAHYAEIVEEHSLLRKLIGVAGDIADIGYSVPEDVKAAVDEAEQMVFNVGRAADGRHHAAAARAAGGRRSTASRSWASAGRTITGVATGYHELDKILLGLPAVVAEHRRAPVPAWARRASPSGVLANVGHAVAAPGPPVLAGDGPPGADPAPAGVRGRGERAEPADGPDPHAGLEQDRHGRDAAVGGADLHRRQPQRDGHGHPGPGPPARRSPRATSASSSSTTCS